MKMTAFWGNSEALTASIIRTIRRSIREGSALRPRRLENLKSHTRIQSTPSHSIYLRSSLGFPSDAQLVKVNIIHFNFLVVQSSRESRWPLQDSNPDLPCYGEVFHTIIRPFTLSYAFSTASSPLGKSDTRFSCNNGLVSWLRKNLIGILSC